MLLVFLILAVVTVCVTIVATYFMLNAEDYRWYVLTVHPHERLALTHPFIAGNGLAFYRAHHPRSMFIYMLFIISSSKQSKRSKGMAHETTCSV